MDAKLLRRACEPLLVNPEAALEHDWFVDLATTVASLRSAPVLEGNDSDDEAMPPQEISESDAVATLRQQVAAVADCERGPLLARLAAQLCRETHWTEADRVATQALEAFPDSVRALRARGEARLRLGLYRAAIADLAQAQSTDYDPNVEDLYKKAQNANSEALRKKGQSKCALPAQAAPESTSDPVSSLFGGIDIASAMRDPQILRAAQTILNDRHSMEALAKSEVVQAAMAQRGQS